MRLPFLIGALAVSAISVPLTAEAQTTERLNPIIALHEKGLPVFGISHPAITAGRGGGGRGRGAAAGAAAAGGVASGGAATAGAAVATATPPAPPPPPPVDLAAVARETVGYKRADYLNTSGAPEAFYRFTSEIVAAGGSVRTHPFVAKVGIWTRNPAAVTQALVRQLNAGHTGILMEQVETAQEVRDVIKAIRFASAGGTRPDTGLATAAAYWGLTVDQYKQKADVWPLNPNGELLVTVIVESRAGVANIREIAAEPGVAQVWAGYGTLGGVYRDEPDGRENAAKQILAACKEFKVPCGFPVNNPAEMEQRIGEGWTVFVMQTRGENGFAAIETGRRLSGR